MDNFIINPNLPQGRVTACIAGSSAVCHALTEFGIDAIQTSPCPELDTPTSAHADMLFHHLGGNKILVHKSQQAAIERLVHMGFNVIKVNRSLKGGYPRDILLNAARVGNYVFCNKRYTHRHILSSGDIVNVKQGYAKCSTLVVSKDAIITADPNIHSCARDVGIHSLLINAGDIKLQGYQYGFIGGCATLLDPSTILFTGNIRAHHSFSSISAFLRNHGIKRLIASRGALVDIGSIIPLLNTDMSSPISDKSISM